MEFNKECFLEKIQMITKSNSGKIRLAINEKKVIETVHGFAIGDDNSSKQVEMYTYDVAWIIPERNETELDCVKRIIKNEIRKYDKSESVNQYYINDIPDWLHLEHRTSLRGSLVDMQADGQEQFELWHAGMMVSVPVTQAREMLKKLEAYARVCLGNTNKHLAAVDKLTTVEEVVKYNYKVGYPEKIRLSF